MLDRTVKRLDGIVPASKRTGESDPRDPNPCSKKRRRAALQPRCEHGPPVRRGKNPMHACRLCGYAIKSGCRDVTVFICCRQAAHRRCWMTQPDVAGKPAICERLVSDVKKDSKMPNNDASCMRRNVLSSSNLVSCDLCGDDLAIGRSSSLWI